MTGNVIHPDWPPVAPGATYDMGQPTSDLAYAFEYGDAPREAAPLGAELPRLTIGQVKSVEAYHVEYGGVEVSNGGGGTELNMQVLGRLDNGKWFSVEAWNDYTGWGCQDGADVRVGDTREQVIAYGLTQDARSALGLAAS